VAAKNTQLWLCKTLVSITFLWFSWSPFDTPIYFLETTAELLKVQLYKTAVAYPLKQGEQVVSVTGIFSPFMKTSFISSYIFSGKAWFYFNGYTPTIRC
jgi:hypothetical protein